MSIAMVIMEKKGLWIMRLQDISIMTKTTMMPQRILTAIITMNW